MNLSQIKMVVTDMDGTLLNSKHEVSTDFFTLFKELKKHNILFVAASGRQYNSIKEKLAPIANDIIIVSENGGFIKQKDTELLNTPLDQSLIPSIIHKISTIEGAHLALCTKYKAYIGEESEHFTSILKQYYANFETINLSEKLPDDVLKIAIYHFESSENHIYPSICNLEDRVKVKISGTNWLDISSLDAHKGFAIEKLMALHQIKPQELLVFGDYNNDLEMLALTDNSVAMANAHPLVLKSAKHTTTSNDDHGVEKVLEKLIADKAIAN